MSSTFILVSPPGPETERLRRDLASVPSLEVVPDGSALLELEGRAGSSSGEEGLTPEGSRDREPPTWILMGPALGGEDRATVVAAAGERRGRWRLLEVEEGSGGFRARPISVGFFQPLESALARVTGENGGEPLLELHEVLGRVARARHDLNNPLTAALAEVQLLLMDAEKGSEGAESLEVVREQLERMRDLITELRTLRAPRAGP